MEAGKARKIVGWSFIGLVTLIGMIVFWQPIYCFWVGRAFAAEDVRSLENQFLAGEHLGNELEFRSGLELQYRLGNGARFGVGFFHLSNAGISESNPGTEALVFSIGLPVSARAD